MSQISNNKSLNLYHAAINKVFSSSRKKDTLNNLKNSLDYKILYQLTDGLSRAIKPLKFTIYGNPLPKKLEELGKSDTLFKPDSVESEIKWVLLSIRKYSKEISLFLLLKKEFENNFLHGNYDKADNILGSILSETGYSIWYIEAKFLLLEYQNKSEEQKEFLSEINVINKNGTIGTISHFLSFRTERNLSAYKYDSDIDSIFGVNKNKSEQDILQYYLFRLNFYENYLLSDYSVIVLFENGNSVIDRYLLTIDILKLLALNNEKRDFVYKNARYIYRKTNDKYLLPLLYLNNLKTDLKEYYQEEYIRILDLYYTGLYEDAVLECTQYLLNKDINFDLIIIYTKCHINLNKKIAKISFESNSLLNQIITKIFDLISSNVIRKDLLYNLYQINKNILSFSISPGLDYFLKKEQNYFVNRNLKLISMNSFDPYFTALFSDINQSNDYLNHALKQFPNSISIKHRKNFLNNELTDDSMISEKLFSIDKAKILFNQEKYPDAIIEWTTIAMKFSNNAPIVQTALKYWFDCLIFLEQYNESIILFVENYISNPNSVSKINTTKLLEILRKIRYRNIRRTIDLPIFVSLNSNDDTEKSFILEQYCKIFNKTKPSELFEEPLDAASLKNELFYYNVCSLETLKHSIYINTTVERLSERLNIINYLIDIFPSKKKIYQEELNLISNELIIYEGTQKLEESKIYANDQAIINYELNEIEGLFNRYKTIYKLSLKDKKILVISNNSFAFYKLDEKEKYNETEVKYTDSALLEVFHELFDSILDKYLYSKFGIVAYLSTRIRHGVLLGEIRPEIEKQNLILNRIGNTNLYEESKHWNLNFYDLTISQKNILHEILTKFSLKIDTIIEDIIKERIQIRKDDKNPNGLFNYEFDKNELYSYAIDLSIEPDVKSFSQKVIDLIWKRTDANLEVIRDYIDGEIKNKFSEELNNLDKELRVSFSTSQLPQIFTNLVECTTIIENKINKISSWFKRSGSSIDDFDIQKVFNIVWNNTEKCYPKIIAECNVTLEINPTIKSNYYIHFTDLFRIMLDNMFKYSEERGGKKEFSFSCTEADGFMICRFLNYKELGAFDIPLKTKDGQLMIDTIKLISENKSGISKAIKIVKFDLGNELNYICVVTDNPEKFIIEIAININNLIRHEKDSNS